MRLHVRDSCTYCGSRRPPLREIVFHGTGQPALRCADVIACVRRQARRKCIRLEGSPLPRRLVADETYFRGGEAA